MADKDEGPLKIGPVAVKGALEIDTKTPHSCKTAVVVERGTFFKYKTRSEAKAWWEHWMLEIWHEVLRGYSNASGIDLRAPRPMMLFTGNPPGEKVNVNNIGTTLGMTYAAGENVTKLINYRRDELRVNHGPGHLGERFTELFPAAAFYLGALSQVKENERLLHGDYQPRHVILNHSEPCFWVFDVENSRTGDEDSIRKEEMDMAFLLKRLIGRKYPSHTIEDALEAGKSAIPKGIYLLPDIVPLIEKRHGFHLDFQARRAYKDPSRLEPFV